MSQVSPSEAAQYVNIALQAFQARDRDASAAYIARALKADPPLGDRWRSVSKLAATLGEISLALMASRKAVQAVPSLDNRLALAQLLQQSGRMEASLEQSTALLRDYPNDPAVRHFLATSLVQLNRQEEAMTHLRRIIALPTVAAGAENAWHVIADLKTFTADDPDVTAMEQHLARLPDGPGTREGRVVMLYALGKGYDDQGRVDDAFACFDEAARLQKPSSSFDADRADAYVQDIVSEFDRSFLDSLPPSQETSNRPIFVLGLPRSGTTLVEQILVSHDQVHDGAEVNLFRPASMALNDYLARELRESLQGPGGASLPTRIARTYLHLLNERFGKEGRVVDKTLNNTRHLGVIHHVLPGARFVWLRRHPAGIAWSCYRTRFARGVDWTRSLGDIARYFKSEDRLHAHWTTVLGDRLLTVPYEELVSDPDTWIARILAHVDLPYQEGLRDFHKTDRAVSTASFAQVRKPLYSSSKDAWKRYEQHLKPFFDEYENPRGK